MANNNKQSGIVRLFPDWPIFRRYASKTKIRLATRDAISDEDVKKGESGEAQSVVEACKAKNPKSYSVINAQIDKLFNDMPAYKAYDVKQLEKVRTDILFCYFAYGFSPTEYFVFRLENKPAEQRKEFISSRLRMIYRCKMNDILKAGIFNDKAETYIHFKPYYHREAVVIEKPSDYDRYSDFVSRHPVFVKKAVFEAQGVSVELIDTDKCGKSKRALFDDLIRTGKHILEERIVQTKEMSAFNESSVNTVRVVTLNTRHGIVVPYCTIRTGRPGSFVDNGGAGGVQAAINYETGSIYTDGYDEMGGVYPAHPSSGTVFKGYQFPEWDRLKALVEEVASKVPQIRFTGWDLAHTKDGWIIVEGNENCYIIAQQMIKDQGMRSIFESIMKDMDLNA